MSLENVVRNESMTLALATLFSRYGFLFYKVVNSPYLCLCVLCFVTLQRSYFRSSPAGQHPGLTITHLYINVNVVLSEMPYLVCVFLQVTATRIVLTCPVLDHACYDLV